MPRSPTKRVPADLCFPLLITPLDSARKSSECHLQHDANVSLRVALRKVFLMTEVNTQKLGFAEMAIPQELVASLKKGGYEEATPIQRDAIPPALTGRDVVGCAQTGTGKTAAFAIPMLTNILRDPDAHGLVLAPTRELAMQIFQVVDGFARELRIPGAILIGGDSFPKQVAMIRRGCRFIIATPGRLVDHLQQGTIKLPAVTMFVLDEFDRMLDMGFAPQLARIVAALPKKRQTMLFSATVAADMAAKVSKFVIDPVRVSIGDHRNKASSVQERNLAVKAVNKGEFLVKELGEVATNGRTLIFTRTQQRVERVAKNLAKEGYEVAVLHGGRSMRQRIAAMRVFKTGAVPILVATDIAGRGLDVDDIQTVINFDLPATREDYIHRVGRTGRYGKSGLAINFCLPEDRDLVRRLNIHRL